MQDSDGQPGSGVARAAKCGSCCAMTNTATLASLCTSLGLCSSELASRTPTPDDCPVPWRLPMGTIGKVLEELTEFVIAIGLSPRLGVFHEDGNPREFCGPTLPFSRCEPHTGFVVTPAELQVRQRQGCVREELLHRPAQTSCCTPRLLNARLDTPGRRQILEAVKLVWGPSFHHSRSEGHTRRLHTMQGSSRGRGIRATLPSIVTSGHKVERCEALNFRSRPSHRLDPLMKTSTSTRRIGRPMRHAGTTTAGHESTGASGQISVGKLDSGAPRGAKSDR